MGSFRHFLKFVGPSLLMSAALLDPGNLEGDLQMGATTGYKLLWVLALSSLLGYLVQICALKIGTVTGQDLAQVCRAEYPPSVRYPLWVVIELAIIGADIQEVVGSAIAISILSNGAIPLWGGTIISVVVTFCLLFLDEINHRALEGLFGLLISTMAISFMYMCLKAGPPVGEVLTGTFVPYLEKSQLAVGVGMIGCTVMPFNIFLHSFLVLSRPFDRTSLVKTKEAIYYFNLETSIIVVVAFVINLCIVCVFAVVAHGKPEAHTIGLSDAANVLSSYFGFEMRYVWAVGLIASGQAAVMAGGLAGQTVMLGFLNLKVSKWKRLLYSRAVAVAPTLMIVCLYQNSHALDTFNELLNIWQSIALPFALIPLFVFASSTALMGELKIDYKLLTPGIIVGGLTLVDNAVLMITSLNSACYDGMIGRCIGGSFLSALYFGMLIYALVFPFLRKQPFRLDEGNREPLLAVQQSA